MVLEQAVAVNSLDHAVLPVMDLWRAERFYTEALGGRIFQKLGMTFEEVSGRGGAPAGAFVKLGRNHIGLFLQNRTPVQSPPDPDAAYPCWSFSVAESDLDRICQQVAQAGGRVGPVRTGRVLGRVARFVRGNDSEGNGLELVADGQGSSEGPGVTGLIRLHSETTDLSASADFYSRFLGAEPVDEGGDWVELGLKSGQSLVFHLVDALSPSMLGPYRGRHFAFHVDEPTFHSLVARLHEGGIEEGDVRGAEPGGTPYTPDRVDDVLGTYFNDPSGLRLQLISENSAEAAEGRGFFRYAPA